MLTKYSLVVFFFLLICIINRWVVGDEETNFAHLTLTWQESRNAENPRK